MKMNRDRTISRWLGVLLVVVMLLSLLPTFILTTPVAAAGTTSVIITKYDAHGNVLSTQNVTWEQMRDGYMGLPVYGDGIIHYYCEGPNFDPARTFDTLWDPNETGNIDSRDYGAAIGTDIKDLCNLVGGASPGDTVTTKAQDGWSRTWDYENVYTPDPRFGRLVLTWYTKDAVETNSGYVSDNYTTGMRLLFFTNITDATGRHVFGDYDEYLTMPENRWYCYYDGQLWPTTSGPSGKWISKIDIRPPKMVSCDISGNTKETFAPGETVYVKGLGLTASINYNLWLQPEPAVWFNQAHGDTVPGFTMPTPLNSANDPSGSQELVATNASGDFAPTAIWTINSSATPQKYDIVADKQDGSANVGNFDTNDGCDSPGFQGFTVAQPPMAAFTADVTSGTAPLIVSFTDQSTQTPTSWAWDFDNDGVVDSTIQNPSYTYSTAGTYTVNLTVKNAAGSNSEVKTGYIIVAAPPLPVAAFTADVTSGTAPLTVHFTNQSTGTPTAWSWDFNNDGVVDSTIQNPSYTYSAAGTYTVNLTVKNAAGSNSEVKTGYIIVLAPSSNQPDCDLNGDHVCNICDVVVIGLHWGETGTPGWIPQDLNRDGVIDALDVALIDRHWGEP